MGTGSRFLFAFLGDLVRTRICGVHHGPREGLADRLNMATFVIDTAKDEIEKRKKAC